jgi:uncharacterized membrane protein YhhN
VAAVKGALLGTAAAAAGAYLVALGVHAPAVALVAKPVPALCLAALALGSRTGYARTIAAGLVLSAAGDVLLERPQGFLPGLGAFFGAHLAYLAGFVGRNRRRHLPLLPPFLAWTGGAAAWLWDGMGPLRGPVLGYMAAITLMMWRAAALGGPAAWGAALFGLSDTLIAIDRFGAPIPFVRYPLILLYWAGQLGIAASAQEAAAGHWAASPSK